MNYEPSGVIFDIQRWSVDDGPGVRTTLFFKGCPLHCVWCSNPEAWSAKPQLGLFPDRCHGCAACIHACAGEQRLRRWEIVSPAKRAVSVWMFAPMEPGRPSVSFCTAEEILARLEKDRVFHRRSGGGVTFSGGEATSQPSLLRYLAERLGRSGVHLVLETCGHFSWSENESALGWMDLVYFDLKHMDSRAHERLTGAGNELILSNAMRMAEAGIPMIVRLPLIPGWNDADENLERTARFVTERLGATTAIEILPYHVLGRHKHQAIGACYALDGLLPPSAETVSQARARLEAHGARVIG